MAAAHSEFKFLSNDLFFRALTDLAMLADRIKFMEQYYYARPRSIGGWDKETLKRLFSTLAKDDHKDHSQIQIAVNSLPFPVGKIKESNIQYDKPKEELPLRAVSKAEFETEKSKLLQFLLNIPIAKINNVYRAYFQRQYDHYASNYGWQTGASDVLAPLTPNLTTLLSKFGKLAPDAKKGLSEFRKKLYPGYQFDDIQAFHLVCAIFVGRDLLENPKQFKSMPFEGDHALNILVKELNILFQAEITFRIKEEQQAKQLAEARAKKEAEDRERARIEEEQRAKAAAEQRERAERERQAIESARIAEEEKRERERIEAEQKAEAEREAKYFAKFQQQQAAEKAKLEAELAEKAKVEAELNALKAQIEAQKNSAGAGAKQGTNSTAIKAKLGSSPKAGVRTLEENQSIMIAFIKGKKLDKEFMGYFEQRKRTLSDPAAGAGAGAAPSEPTTPTFHFE